VRPQPELHTPRLLLRPVHEVDREAIAAMNGDERVMAHFPAAMTRAESDAMVDRLQAFAAQHGFGAWTVEAEGAFAGLVFLAVPRFEAPFQPAVEIGWRFAAATWGRGYAPEAARAVLDHAFGALELREIVSFTVPANLPSQRVMQKLGMRHDPADDFDHPAFAPGHRLRRHVLYRIRAGE
jgi:RimJ/RimL family protein N-acetyltransferase